MQVCDVSAVFEKILEGKGYNVITLHDINVESLSKFLWMWAKSGSIHDETAEFKNELLDNKRFGMDGVVAHVQRNLKTPEQVKNPRAIHSATQNPLVPRGENDVALKLRRV